ncbi:MAG: 6-carboxytetrahydropterin synthase, partial [Nitrospira sp.]|nr:6-carboxytetrahydropterin synthase [Nitrospira sp.]
MAKATLTKRLEFCASHRYHNAAWDDAKNREVFGPCNNINTHGHNYLLEVTLEGEIDPVTGMIINLYDLKIILS